MVGDLDGKPMTYHLSAPPVWHASNRVFPKNEHLLLGVAQDHAVSIVYFKRAKHWIHSDVAYAWPPLSAEARSAEKMDGRKTGFKSTSRIWWAAKGREIK